MSVSIEQLLEVDDAELADRWACVERWVGRRFDRETSIEGVLFLIGIQSRGRGFEPDLEKEIKQDVVMEGTYCAFETLGLYQRVGIDEDGSWLWERAVERIPKLPVEQQEKLLKLGIVRYFDDVVDASSDRDNHHPV